MIDMDLLMKNINFSTIEFTQNFMTCFLDIITTINPLGYKTSCPIMVI